MVDRSQICASSNARQPPRAEDGYGTDAVEPAGWPMTIEEEVETRQAQASAEQLARMPAQGRS